MSNALRENMFKLTAAERLELVEDLWDSIAAERENEPFPLSEAQREELDRRLRELDEHPERARPWEEVRERLGRGSGSDASARALTGGRGRPPRRRGVV